jgi:hypothetical protein
MDAEIQLNYELAQIELEKRQLQLERKELELKHRLALLKTIDLANDELLATPNSSPEIGVDVEATVENHLSTEQIVDQKMSTPPPGNTSNDGEDKIVIQQQDEPPRKRTAAGFKGGKFSLDWPLNELELTYLQNQLVVSKKRNRSRPRQHNQSAHQL